MDDMANDPIPIPPHKLSNEELDEIRAILLQMKSLDAVTPKMREIIETYWPDLAEKLPPKE